MTTGPAAAATALSPNDPACGNPTSDSVTVVVRRRVKAGREADYERWLHALIEDASSLPGYLGAQTRPPTADTGREYTSIFRFASVEQLRAFERSDLRRRALAQVADLVEADATWDELTGLEVWFSPPPGTVAPQPSRWRMALLLTIVVYGLVLSIGRIVATVLADAPPSLRLLVTIALEVLLMTYLLMPWLTRKLARLLYPRRSTHHADAPVTGHT